MDTLVTGGVFDTAHEDAMVPDVADADSDTQLFVAANVDDVGVTKMATLLVDAAAAGPGAAKKLARRKPKIMVAEADKDHKYHKRRGNNTIAARKSRLKTKMIKLLNAAAAAAPAKPSVATPGLDAFLTGL